MHWNGEIIASELQDPLLHSARMLIAESYMTHQEILDKYDSIQQEIDRVSAEVIKLPKLSMIQVKFLTKQIILVLSSAQFLISGEKQL